ncbi:hypothetical protein GCM10023149_15660 [Mucilaginibacter gynuensis]|uniref:FAS1 domain-containing protein n=1 Tax=Mucilaginibacter gynuensis TaxID=1302236 RepID=A0ABP8G5R1_9SPHI
MSYKTEKMNIKILALCLLVLILASCTKKEFQPEVEGAPIPAEDIESIKFTVKQVLEASPYTLFKAAWKRSDMDSIINKRGVDAPLTLLVPTDAAFLADGLTLEVINNTTPAMLDSLLLYHTLSQATTPHTLSSRDDNTSVFTLLENPYLKARPFENVYTPDRYFYKQYMKVKGNELFLNGKKSGSAAITQAKNGVLWPVDHVLHKPTKSIMQVLQEDSRFSMYLEIMTKTDMLWDEAMMGVYQRPSYFQDGLIVTDNPYSISYAISFTSVFVPTNEAFRAAGFNSVDDLMALNNRNPLPYFDWDTFEAVGTGYATDTLLTMHRWGRLFKQQDAFGYGKDNPDAFYSNDLNNTLLANYALSSSGYTGTIPILYVPLDFGADGGGRVTVKVKGSEKEAATVIEADINTLMGPVHVVNRLMPPKGFKY